MTASRVSTHRLSGLARAYFLILLVFYLQAPEAQALPKWFDFEAKLHSPAARNEKRVLRRGALLYPMVPGSNMQGNGPDRKPLYQPVVLCEDLELHFDEHGVSQPVHVQGFCSAPGLKSTGLRISDGFDWTITGVFNTEVATSSDCRKAWIGSGGDKDRWPGVPISSVTCKKDPFDCREEFTRHTEERYGRTLDDVVGDRTCRVFEKIEGLKRVGSTLNCYR